jgi:hypothetical protein
LLPHSIKGNDVAKEHPDGVITLGRWCISVQVEDRLEPASRVVSEISNCASRQGREPGARSQLLITKILAQKLDRILLTHFSLPILFDNGLSPTPTRHHPGIRAQERIAGYPLAAFD